MNPLFITGNVHKAEHMRKLLRMPMDHLSLDLVEIQSVRPEEIIEYKVREAYVRVERPVFVDDFSLWFDELGGLPGPFIKYFVSADEGLEKLCRMADGLASRRATARAYFGYFDGSNVTVLHGEVKGEIAEHPRGEAPHAFGSDPIFCVDGYGGRSRAELNRQEYDDVYRAVRGIDAIRRFFEGRL